MCSILLALPWSFDPSFVLVQYWCTMVNICHPYLDIIFWADCTWIIEKPRLAVVKHGVSIIVCGNHAVVWLASFVTFAVLNWNDPNKHFVQILIDLKPKTYRVGYQRTQWTLLSSFCSLEQLVLRPPLHFDSFESLTNYQSYLIIFFKHRTYI